MTLHQLRRSASAFATALAWGALTSAVPFAAANAQERPAAAQRVAANTNVAFQTLDGSQRSADFVRTGAAMASREKIAIIVWGGNADLQRQAFSAAQDLNGQGIPLAFILGPDLNGLDGDANFQVYARGVAVFEDNGANIGQNYVAEVRSTVVRMGQTAFRDHFPREAAALGLVPTP